MDDLISQKRPLNDGMLAKAVGLGFQRIMREQSPSFHAESEDDEWVLPVSRNGMSKYLTSGGVSDSESTASATLLDAIDDFSARITAHVGATESWLRFVSVVLERRSSLRKASHGESSKRTQKIGAGAIPKVVLYCLHQLQVPKLFAAQSVKDVDKVAFSRRSALSFDCLVRFLDQDDWIESQDVPLGRMLFTCAVRLGDVEKKWTNIDSGKGATLLLDKLQVVCEVTSREEIVTFLGVEALKEARPFFEHPAARDRRSLPADESSYDHQLWKTDRPDVVRGLEWILSSLSLPGSADAMIGLLLPPLLTIMDDYEVCWKMAGIRMLTQLVPVVSTSVLRRTGLGDALLQALLTSLSFQDDTALVRTAMEALFSLLPLLGEPGSEEFHDRVEKVLDEGVISGLNFARSGNEGTVDCLFSSIPGLVSMQGILILRHLKQLLDLSCEVISAEHLPMAAQIRACRVLLALIEACGEVICRRRGQILASVAESWIHLHKALAGASPEGMALELRGALCGVAQRLRAACGEAIEVRNLRTELSPIESVHIFFRSSLISRCYSRSIKRCTCSFWESNKPCNPDSVSP